MMPLRNRDGTPVDPVPFFVASSFAFLVCFSFGPPYVGHVLTVSLPHALAVSAAVFLGLTAFAYYRFVWTATPKLRAAVPASLRFARLVYLAAAIFLVLVLLALPLFVTRG